MADISKINVNNTEYNVKDATARSKQIIEGQASGSIATFSDGGNNIPMKSCEVAIVAQQASGTPSPLNPLSISGFDTVVITNKDDLDNPTTTDTHTITLPETIYGGTAELVGGNGTKEWVKVDLSQLDFQRTGSGVFYTTDLDSYIAPTPSDSVASLNIKSSIFQSIPRDDIVGSPDGSMAQRAGGIVYFQYTSASTVEAFKTAMQNVDFICKLATPTAFTFTGANIPTLSGVNNVYADSGDVNALEYYNKNADEIAELIRVLTQ